MKPFLKNGWSIIRDTLVGKGLEGRAIMSLRGGRGYGPRDFVRKKGNVLEDFSALGRSPGRRGWKEVSRGEGIIL